MSDILNGNWEVTALGSDFGGYGKPSILTLTILGAIKKANTSRTVRRPRAALFDDGYSGETCL
jgi:hypothetical protein